MRARAMVGCLGSRALGEDALVIYSDPDYVTNMIANKFSMILTYGSFLTD